MLAALLLMGLVPMAFLSDGSDDEDDAQDEPLQATDMVDPPDEVEDEEDDPVTPPQDYQLEPGLGAHVFVSFAPGADSVTLDLTNTEHPETVELYQTADGDAATELRLTFDQGAMSMTFQTLDAVPADDIWFDVGPGDGPDRISLAEVLTMDDPDTDDPGDGPPLDPVDPDGPDPVAPDPGDTDPVAPTDPVDPDDPDPVAPDPEDEPTLDPVDPDEPDPMPDGPPLDPVDPDDPDPIAPDSEDEPTLNPVDPDAPDPKTNGPPLDPVDPDAPDGSGEETPLDPVDPNSPDTAAYDEAAGTAPADPEGADPVTVGGAAGTDPVDPDAADIVALDDAGIESGTDPVAVDAPDAQQVQTVELSADGLSDPARVTGFDPATQTLSIEIENAASEYEMTVRPDAWDEDGLILLDGIVAVVVDGVPGLEAGDIRLSYVAGQGSG